MKVHLPYTGGASGYTVKYTVETLSTLKALHALCCATHDIEVDTSQLTESHSRYIEKQTRITAVRPNTPQLLVGLIPGKKVLAELQYSSFEDGIHWENNKVRLLKAPEGWIPEDGQEKRLDQIMKDTHLDLPTLSYILSGMLEGSLSAGDLPFGGYCRVGLVNHPQEKTPDTIRIDADTLYVGDPCYKSMANTMHVLSNVCPGFWDYHYKLSKGFKKPSCLEVRHFSTRKRTLHYRKWHTLKIDSGMFGVYSPTLKDLLGTTNEFYEVVSRGTCRCGCGADVFNYRGQGVIVATLYGDGDYNVRVAVEGDKVVGIKVNF